MGSVARTNRCERFINEFDADAQKYYSMSDFPNVINEALGIDELFEVVRMYVSFEYMGQKEILFSPTIFFDPEWRDYDLIDATCEYFNLEEEVAIARLKKAELITENY